jgi:predicted O-linked N-acetylglucosamine transferase (SPINDLY family)
VQVSFLGYPDSAGVEAIPYRISGRGLEMEKMQEAGGRSQDYSAPRSHPASCDLHPASGLYLLDSFWCYDPEGIDIAVNESPARASGHVTFGSLNNFCKFNDPVWKLWARVLGNVRDSHLLILSAEGAQRQRVVEIFAREGIAAERLEFFTRRPRGAYLDLYHRLDIALDPYPYNGHTTSLEALWMGVPVVTLAGENPVSRGALSILHNLGLPELVATTANNYLRIATELAHDLPRLSHLRATLRSRMESSVLMDAPHFARQIEAAYRAMWREWCHGSTESIHDMH